MDEAFDALERGDRVLALRLAQRAREAGSMNPRILVDFAQVARSCGATDDAEQALRAAIAAAPNFAYAFAALADLLWSVGRTAAAVRLMAHARELGPHDPEVAVLAQRLDAAAAGAGGGSVGDGVAAAGGGDRTADPGHDAALPFGPRTEWHDWSRVAAQIVQRGPAVISRLLSVDECTALRQDYAAGAQWFEHETEVAVADGVTGSVRGCWLRELPPWLLALRAELYARAAVVVDHQFELLGERRRVPPTLSAWQRSRERAVGSRPAVRVLALPPALATATFRTDERKAFPLRVVVDLGPGDGQVPLLQLLDQRPGKKLRSVVTATAAGDAVLFPCRERLCQVAGVHGLQSVRWALGPVPVERFVLEIGFDDE